MTDVAGIESNGWIRVKKQECGCEIAGRGTPDDPARIVWCLDHVLLRQNRESLYEDIYWRVYASALQGAAFKLPSGFDYQRAVDRAASIASIARLAAERMDDAAAREAMEKQASQCGAYPCDGSGLCSEHSDEDQDD